MKRTFKFNNLNIRTKLTLVFIMTSMIIFVVNLYVYANLNRMIEKIDDIYASNISINEMSETLAALHESMTEYLKTKGTDELKNYYKNYETYSDQLEEFGLESAGDEIRQMERMIRNLSATYLDVTSQTVQAKRGRNIEKYISGYDEAERLYSYIDTYIYSLNNEQFKNNSDSYETLLASLKYSQVLNLSILAAVTFINIMIITIMTRTITSPLMELSRRANEVSEGRVEDVDQIPVRYEDEVGTVTRAFNQMLLSIREYISRIRQQMETESAMKEKELMMETHLKEAQLKYLQAQINPHFLFNTLNAGAQLAMLEGADKTNRYVQNMADFFRYSVKKNNDIVNIDEELKLVDSYIYILNVRFSGDIHFEKDIDETLLNVSIPSMIIQPLVENSVNYGIRDIDREGRIKISLYREGDMACISVKDNGIGIPDYKIKKIIEQEYEPDESSSDSNGVGLANVISRLDLFYGGKDIFDIISEGVNKGTEVIIKVPVEN